ncbi:MAG TPA: glutathione S-transferase N-terminal domain-containing protein [Phenylobacterium sp.]|nr:glutathione S-transferase N-terminal domain-containing protein [Phenylobacterium sp.]
MTLRLHHAPMACSLASRLALAESGLPHEVAIVRTWLGEQKTDAYRRINPRGKVPALETDRGVITESTAILPFIADLAPDKALLPPAGTFERAQAQAWLSFLSSTLHASLSAAMFPVEGCEEIARDAALSRVVGAFSDLDGHLDGRDHLLDAFSLCDLYMLVFLLWRAAPALSGRLPSFPNLDRLQQALLARPGVMAIVADEMKLRSQAATA